jgi:hypothetical protein
VQRLLVDDAKIKEERSLFGLLYNFFGDQEIPFSLFLSRRKFDFMLLEMQAEDTISLRGYMPLTILHTVL